MRTEQNMVQNTVDISTKIDNMKQDELLNTFMQGAGIEKDSDGNVAIGTLVPALAPAGVEAVMKTHTQRIDKLLQLLPGESLLRYKLLAVRAFRFSEYQQLFQTGITQQTLQELAICKVLHITNEKERKRFILPLTNRYEDYLKLLSQFFQTHGSLRLQTFFFPARFDCSYQVRCSYTHSGKNRSREKQADGIDGVGYAKEITEVKKVCYGDC